METAWFCFLAVMVTMYVILDGFDLGIGILFPFTRSESERDQMMRSIAPPAVCAEKPPTTSRPEAAASSATFISGPVRRSSITSTSGSSRSAVRAAATISSSSPRTSRWLMNEWPPSWTMLISRSMVMM